MSKWIKPLQLGSLLLPSNLIQGPLAGYSCSPFRKAIYEYGGVGYTTTEMISAYNLAHGMQQPRRYLYKDPNEGLVCYQLSGNVADNLAVATEKVGLSGADLVDLNCGCPQPKIRKKNSGSKLLSQPEQLYSLLKAMRSATDKPLSAKIRVDGDSGERFNVEVVQAIESAGADFIVVHGRHWRERYDMAVRISEIASLVSQVEIPLIANGDVADLASAEHMLQATGAAGVMISRATLGQPWLFAEIVKQSQGNEYVSPTFDERIHLLLQHVLGLVELDGEYKALLQARKLPKYYFPECCPPAVHAQTLSEFKVYLSGLQQPF